MDDRRPIRFAGCLANPPCVPNALILSEPARTSHVPGVHIHRLPRVTFVQTPPPRLIVLLELSRMYHLSSNPMCQRRHASRSQFCSRYSQKTHKLLCWFYVLSIRKYQNVKNHKVTLRNVVSVLSARETGMCSPTLLLYDDRLASRTN